MTQGAPKDNQFWRLRSKHGRDAIFASGEMIEKAVDEFLMACYNNPLFEHDYVGKDAIEVDKRKFRIPTWQRFCLFCGVNTVYFNHLEKRVSDRQDEVSKDITKAITCARELFYTEKLEAASAGLANPGLITRVLGLTDKQEVIKGRIKVVAKKPKQ